MHKAALLLTSVATLAAGCATVVPVPALDVITGQSGATLTDAQRAYDVRHYTLDIGIYPETKRIEGTVSVRFVAIESMDAIELDLDTRMTVTAISFGRTPLTFEQVGGKLTARFAETIPAGAERIIGITYGGKPHIGLVPPWKGGLVWSTTLDDGLPWVATAVQGQGCDLWWPCKDHYGDKPDDGLDIIVSVPETVKVATNGVLLSQTPVENGRHSFHWRTKHPSTGYAVSVNVGPFVRIEDTYAGVNGTQIPIEFWVLPENEEAARSLIETDAKPHLAFFERLLGPYPWGDEKVGFVETPHLGMEHQTINAYGAGYPRGKHGFDWLMHHELAHEWFGNVMTHKAASDAWLHEGYASYMQAEYAGRVVGDMAYAESLYTSYMGSEHCKPVADPSVLNVGEVLGNGDIYTKGSWLLHTLRQHIGDDAFWAGTRELVFGTQSPWDMQYPIAPRYRSTDDLIEIMSRTSGIDVRWIVEAYLLEKDIPSLEMKREGGKVDLAWVVGSDRDFPMPLTLSIDGESVELPMIGGVGSVNVSTESEIIVDPAMKVFRRMPIIGTCEERTAADEARITRRQNAMAKQYRWQRH